MDLKRLMVFFIGIFIIKSSIGQYPFEQYPAIKYQKYYGWKTYDRIEKEKKVHSTLTIPSFYENGDTLTIQLTSFSDHWFKNSIIRTFRNKTLSQKIMEDMIFNPEALDTVWVADINGDGLKDIKIVIPYMGCGLASLNVKMIYLFQTSNETFIKISFLDKMYPIRPERDMDGDRNFEIITQHLAGYQNHNYWVFDIFNYMNQELVNTNYKFNYPIMIQYLYRENYQVTTRISKEKMKEFGLKLPEDYDKNELIE